MLEAGSWMECLYWDKTYHFQGQQEYRSYMEEVLTTRARSAYIV